MLEDGGERVPHAFVVGDDEEGFDFEAITDILRLETRISYQIWAVNDGAGGPASDGARG